MMSRGLKGQSSTKPTATIVSRKLPLTLSTAVIVAAAILAALGWRFSAADVGPKVPPLSDLEAALTGPDPIVRIAAPVTDAPPGPPSRGLDLAPAAAPARPTTMPSAPPHQISSTRNTQLPLIDLVDKKFRN